MKYILADSYNGHTTIDTITEDPIAYARKFEPIDVINGKMVAWDEKGNLYYFGPDKQLEKTRINKRVSLVEVGQWEEDEPQLVKVKEDQEVQLKTTLLHYLENRAASRNGRFWKRKTKASQANAQYRTMSLDELLARVEELFV